MTDYTITKTNVECYKLRKKGGYWADITLDCGDKAGRLIIAADFGSWNYYWGACGCSFKEFIMHLDIHYTAGKFNANKHFDHDATIALWREQFKSVQVLTEVNNLSNLTDEREFIRELHNCSFLLNQYDGMPVIVYGLNPLFERFWNEVWLIFIETIKREITQ